MEEPVTAQSYTLYGENNEWLGQIVLTSDGMFAAVTDYGNFSFAWRAYGDCTFKDFLLSLNTDYFATKMSAGFSYVATSKKIDQGAQRFSDVILTALQKVLKSEKLF